jgi:hypothetical protein
MLTAIVLVCLLSLTPNLRDCTQETAVQVLRVPEQTQFPGTCLKIGLEFFSQTEFSRHLTGDERVKVVCVPPRRIYTTSQ